MKLRSARLIGVGGALLAAAAWGQTPPKPTLPAGHPDVPARSSGTLPSGHPGIPGAAPSTRPAAQFGTVIFRTSQGTKGGPAVGPDAVSLQMYAQGKVLHKIDGKLDNAGGVMFSRIPLAIAFQPVVTVTHAGVEYVAVGDVMDPYHDGQELGLAVYELADKEPDWNIHMRHLLVQPTASGVHVTDVFALMSGGDRVWTGRPQPDGKRVTFAVEVPAGAQDVKVESGAREGAIRIESGRIVNTAALQPGVSQFQFSYTLPVAPDGQAKLDIVAPGVVKHLMLAVPDNGTAVTAKGLTSSGKFDVGDAKSQVFTADEQKPGDRASVTITVPKPAKADAGAAAGGVSSNVAKVVAGVGGGLGLAVGTGYVLLKPAAPAPAQTGRRARVG